MYFRLTVIQQVSHMRVRVSSSKSVNQTFATNGELVFTEEEATHFLELLKEAPNVTISYLGGE